MTLEFERRFIEEHSYQELGFEAYLGTFELEMPIIPRRILRPLEKREAEIHFQKLEELDSSLTNHRVDCQALLLRCRHLPSLEEVIPYFEDQKLEPFHLFQLGRFLHESSILDELESGGSLPLRSEVCGSLRRILETHTAEGFSRLVLSPAESELHNAINDLTEKISSELTAYERSIYQETGIQLVYPFPREFRRDDELLERVKQCRLLNLVESGDLLQTEFVLSASINALIKEKERRQQQWDELISEKMMLLNRELFPFFQAFVEHYRLRKERVFQYMLLSAKHRHDYTIPKLGCADRLVLKEGVLPLLKQYESEHYKPLNLVLPIGVSILFGANMTGKTIVLKTLYFNLMLVKFGLPVPAKSFFLTFPEDVGIHLRTSGKTGSGLSGFGEEVRFFCAMQRSSAVYLMDELFHSTDPINGVRLTEAFLEGLAGRDSIFLCTSHYPGVLDIPGVRFFKMKDIDEDSNRADIDRLLANVPYELETISADSMKEYVNKNKTPLRIALRFPLPESILKSIQTKLNI